MTLPVSRPVIFNQCAAAQWCDMKGPQVCCRSLGEGQKEAGKKLRIKKIIKVNFGSAVYFS
jgi:hypothetical protein